MNYNDSEWLYIVHDNVNLLLDDETLTDAIQYDMIKYTV